MNISLFGPLQCHDGGRTLRASDLGGAKPRGLLELLLLARGRTVSKEQLAEALWGERQPQHVAGALEHYVCVLRRRLFPDQALARRVLVTEAGAYRFDTSLVSLDLDEFDRLVRQAEHAEEGRRRVLLSQAVDLARHDLLDDAPYAPWAMAERERYRGRVTRAHLAIARECLGAGQYDSAVRHGESALQSSAYSEEAFRILMVADHALGHADLARTAYRRCRDVLAEHLGVDPTSETDAVAAAIDAGMPADELVRAFLDRALHGMLAAA